MVSQNEIAVKNCWLHLSIKVNIFVLKVVQISPKHDKILGMR